MPLSNKDRKYLRLCQVLADEFSKDPSLKVGAYIIRPDGSPVSWGYNGYPMGIDDVNYSFREYKHRRIIHAEQNALNFAYESLNDCTLYTNIFPCNQCAASIIQRGIKRVVSGNVRFMCESLNHDVSIAMFKETNVEFEVDNA